MKILDYKTINFKVSEKIFRIKIKKTLGKMMIFFNKIILSKILLGMKNQTKKLTKMQ